MEKPINMVDFASRVCLGPGSVTEAEHRALKDITKPTSRYKAAPDHDEGRGVAVAEHLRGGGCYGEGKKTASRFNSGRI